MGHDTRKARTIFGTCKHPKLTTVQEDGYQYCFECGKAFAPPPLHPKPCEHQWVERDKCESGSVLTNHTSYYLYVLQCTKCGEMRQLRTLQSEKSWKEVFDDA
jgi:hypothetical protein